MYKEYTQMEYMKVMGSLEPEILKRLHKKGEPWAINLIKEKQRGKLKERTCTDGQPQRCYITK